MAEGALLSTIVFGTSHEALCTYIPGSLGVGLPEFRDGWRVAGIRAVGELAMVASNLAERGRVK